MFTLMKENFHNLILYEYNVQTFLSVLRIIYISSIHRERFVSFSFAVETDFYHRSQKNSCFIATRATDTEDEQACKREGTIIFKFESHQWPTLFGAVIKERIVSTPPRELKATATKFPGRE